jgi:hypothetical protein
MESLCPQSLVRELIGYVIPNEADAPVVFVKAEELPKGALVEFQVNFHNGRHSLEGDIDEDDLEGEYSSRSTQGMSWENCSASVKGQGGRAIIYLHGKSFLGDPVYH